MALYTSSKRSGYDYTALFGIQNRNRGRGRHALFDIGWPYARSDSAIHDDGTYKPDDPVDTAERMSSKEKTIIIGVLLGLVFIAMILGLYCLVRRRRRGRKGMVLREIENEVELHESSRQGASRNMEAEREAGGEAPPPYDQVIKMDQQNDGRSQRT